MIILDHRKVPQEAYGKGVEERDQGRLCTGRQLGLEHSHLSSFFLCPWGRRASLAGDTTL